MERSLRVLELYCGIGGCAAALAGRRASLPAEVVQAIDLSRPALDVYRLNHPHPAACRSIGTMPLDELRHLDADLWWMSPPCQPFTHRGARRDAEDPRAESFLLLLDQIAAIRPPRLALENVPGFAGSDCHARLSATLARAGYATRELDLCPSELGWPNRRRRYYLVASLEPLPPPPASPAPERLPLSAFLDRDPAPDLRLAPDQAALYHRALHRVSGEDPEAVTACFTAAYGRSIVRSGSYLLEPEGPRRFSPAEVLRLLGFPPAFRLPPELSRRKAWALAGNSLSVPAVRRVLAHLLPDEAFGPAAAPVGEGASRK